jgi:starch synthase
MRVLYVAAEAAPIEKVGGLGDVAGSLPPAIKRLGVDIRVAIPWYPDIDVERWKVHEEHGVGETRLGDTDIPVYLLAREVFKETGKHKAILGTKKEEQWFSQFSEAIVEFIKTSEWKPQVFHGNDWHVADALTSLERASAETLRDWGYEEKNLATLVTIHNLSYHTKILSRAILAADMINAVSPSYAREILTEEYCEKLCQELQQRKSDLYGVLNGIDYEVWDPETDELVSDKYNVSSWKDGKAGNKDELRRRIKLNGNDSMLLAFVGRLDPHQKGVLVLANAIDEFVRLGLQVVVLGSGARQAERELRNASRKHLGMSTAIIKYDEALAHQIYAGADALLIPSRFEPCGLIQMIAMKYGTLPIAHAVGGLMDTIEDGRTGFLYKDYYSRGLVRAITRAKEVFVNEPSQWQRMVDSAMRMDFSWDRSAREYVKLYEKALAKSRK